jgi:hypothetical protein
VASKYADMPESAAATLDDALARVAALEQGHNAVSETTDSFVMWFHS